MCVHIITWAWSKVSTVVKTKLFQKYFKKQLPSNPEPELRIGLESNIDLPSTGTFEFSFRRSVNYIKQDKTQIPV